MKWFHRHEFDPEKWELVEKADMFRVGHWGQRAEGPYQTDYLYQNTCKTCGDIVFRKVSN